MELDVAERIPNLWRAGEEAARLYQLYLCRLGMNNRHERIVAACRQIRRYAARGPGRTQGLFAIDIEIDSLCRLGQYQTAWRRLRLREEIVFGKRLDLRRRKWSRDDACELMFSYAPLLFFLGRYRQGCSLLETSLRLSLRDNDASSYDALFKVYNGDDRPKDRARATLSHFYNRLGKNLLQWSQWKTFVHGFHPQLFHLSGVSRESLSADAALLPVFFKRIIELRTERITSGVSWGQSDLTDGPARVKKRQDATRRKREEFVKRMAPVQARTARKLQELFPELQGLPK